MTNTGKDFSLDNDNILEINSPKKSVGGPYVVVFKNIDERWAIVALDWDKEPRLGIRWFWGNGGNPFSSGNGTWLVIPPSLSKNILSGLSIEHKFYTKIDKFLSGEIKGENIVDYQNKE